MHTPVIHFKGLNGIRAVCAFAVVISHTSEGLNLLGGGRGKLLDLAGYGVTAFFALSGFLISFLLMREKEVGEISVSKFYMRRILRIWPLYFTYMAIALVVAYFYVGERDFSALPYYIFFLPTIPAAFHFVGMTTIMPINLLNHYWSLGVEEQFYIVYPHLVKRTRNLLKLCLIIFVIVYGIKITAKIYSAKTGNPFWYALADSSRFDAMAIGGMGAWLYKYRFDLAERIFRNRILQVVVTILLLVIAANQFKIYTTVSHVVVAILTVLVIYYAHNLTRPWINLDKRLPDSLGKISFGIYVYHPLLILLAGWIVRKLALPYWPSLVLFFVLPVVLTVIVAYLSYNYFEKYFLKLKLRFSIVQSKD
jgi:peptidoglycan/LPS O-acetylase OafA/YrhL